MMIKRKKVESKQEAKRQARYNEHIQFEKDYRHRIAERKSQRQSENIKNEADEEVKSYPHNIDGTNAKNELKKRDIVLTKKEK